MNLDHCVNNVTAVRILELITLVTRKNVKRETN